MTMRSQTFLALLFFLCTCVSALLITPGSLHAQVLTVSDELIMRTDTRYDLIGQLGGQALLLQDRDTKHLLTAYDRNMRQVWEKEMELRGKNIRILESVARQDGTAFYLLYLFRDRGRNFLQLDRFNPAGNLQDSTTLVDFGVFVTTPEDDIIRSEDETKLLLLVTEQQTKVRCIGIDLTELKTLYDRELTPDRFFFGEDFVQAELTNEGEMYFIFQRDNFRSKRKEHKYEVHRLTAAEDANSFELNMGDSLTYDIVFRYDNLNRQLVAAGLYTTKDFSRADGYFWIKYVPQGNATARPVFTPFPINLVKNIEGNKFNKKQPNIDELSVSNLVLRQDGGGLIITEKNRQLERRSNASRTQIVNNFGERPLVDYHYDEMIVFSVHPDGEPHWSNILHKKQYSQDDGGVYSSYLMMENPSTLRFLFNDEIRFENTVSEYIVNGRGEFDRNSLFNTRDLNLRLRFRDGVQVAANEVILPSEHRNRLRLVKMTYEVK